MPHVTTEQDSTRYRVVWNNTVLAESDKTIIVHEGSLPPRRYFPPEDVQMELFARASNTARCPWKGEWSHLNMTVGRQTVPNTAWTYFKTIEDGPQIKDYVAFYENKVEVIAV
ncbi:MAG: DUF427 domain-containing protein [Myxococcota bacterium]